VISTQYSLLRKFVFALALSLILGSAALLSASSQARPPLRADNGSAYTPKPRPAFKAEVCKATFESIAEFRRQLAKIEVKGQEAASLAAVEDTSEAILGTLDPTSTPLGAVSKALDDSIREAKATLDKMDGYFPSSSEIALQGVHLLIGVTNEAFVIYSAHEIAQAKDAMDCLDKRGPEGCRADPFSGLYQDKPGVPDSSPFARLISNASQRIKNFEGYLTKNPCNEWVPAGVSASTSD
jgi:hypothetical protein